MTVDLTRIRPVTPVSTINVAY